MDARYKLLLNGNNNKPVEQRQVLISVPVRLQARLNAEQVAEFLHFSERDIPVLCQFGLLKPLGNPSLNSTKYFSSSLLEKLGKDDQWLSDATQTIYDYWRGKNHRKTSKSPLLTKVASQQAIAV
jgi:hypothetical protein